MTKEGEIVAYLNIWIHSGFNSEEVPFGLFSDVVPTDENGKISLHLIHGQRKNEHSPLDDASIN
jgi:hypothetical protein